MPVSVASGTIELLCAVRSVIPAPLLGRYTAGMDVGGDVGMDEFTGRARARESYKAFAQAMQAGREILRRAGVVDPPEIPDFERVFRKLTPEMKAELYAQLSEAVAPGPAEAIRLWQPFLRKAFGQAKA